MAKSKISFNQHYDAVMHALTTHGLLLGSYDAAGKANVMTIGWASLGHLWGMGVWTVLVRPSRYTFRCIEHSASFSINVPPESLAGACAICGSKSGRDADKIAEAHLTIERGSTVLAPVIAECPIVYECQVVHSAEILPAKLAHEILAGAYVDGDFHRIYFGKILAARAEPDAEKLLRQ